MQSTDTTEYKGLVAEKDALAKGQEEGAKRVQNALNVLKARVAAIESLVQKGDWDAEEMHTILRQEDLTLDASILEALLRKQYNGAKVLKQAKISVFKHLLGRKEA